MEITSVSLTPLKVTKSTINVGISHLNNNLDTWDVGFYLKKVVWQALPDQMESDTNYTSTSSLNQPYFFTEEGKITPLSLYGKSPKQITIWVAPVWWFNIPITTKDKLTQVCSDQNRERKNQMLYHKQLQMKNCLETGILIENTKYFCQQRCWNTSMSLYNNNKRFDTFPDHE